MNDEENHSNRDTRISDIECGPGMRVRNVQIEKKKIDHMSIKKAIGKISQDAGEQKRQRDVAPNIGRSSPEEENQNNEKGDR